MKWISFVIAVAVVTAPYAGLAQGPSFDCARAGSPTERAICGSPQLSQQDRVISALYSDLHRALGPAARDRLLTEQRAWLAGRNSCGADKGCIATMSDDRIRVLEARSREVF